VPRLWQVSLINWINNKQQNMKDDEKRAKLRAEAIRLSRR